MNTNKCVIHYSDYQISLKIHHHVKCGNDEIQPVSNIQFAVNDPIQYQEISFFLYTTTINYKVHQYFLKSLMRLAAHQSNNIQVPRNILHYFSKATTFSARSDNNNIAILQVHRYLPYKYSKYFTLLDNHVIIQVGRYILHTYLHTNIQSFYSSR